MRRGGVSCKQVKGVCSARYLMVIGFCNIGTRDV